MKIKIKLAKLLITAVALSSVAYASNVTLQGAINKYKAGNYTGCIQDLEIYTRSERSNALAYYYLAIANVQAGRKTNAIQAYDRVLALHPNETLLDYATKGKVCLEEPSMCYKNQTVLKEEDTELDKFIRAKNQYVYKGAQQQATKNNLDALRNRINSDEEINRGEFREFERSSKVNEEKDLKVATKEEKPASKRVNNMPPNDEVVAAIKVLNQAGLGSIVTQAPAQPQQQAPQVAQNNNQQMQQMMQMMMAQQQNPYAGISAMLGGNNNNNSNQFMNMLPMFMAQGQNGEKGGLSPEVMQAMLMNSMMPDLTFSSSDNNR